MQNHKNVLMLCCLCGISFEPSLSKTNYCLNCIAQSECITDQIEIQDENLCFCRQCRRIQKANNQWVYAQRESKELLQVCLQRLKGMQHLKLMDAVFLYTEEHSRKIKIKVTVQKEVMNAIKLQDSINFEYSEKETQCPDCKKQFTPHTWEAIVQLRQSNAEHKRTIFFIEQMIIKHKMNQNCLNIVETVNGLDFFFKSKANALQLVEFLQSIVMTKIKQSKELISSNAQSGNHHNKFTFSVEIPTVCRDDLIVIPNKLKSFLSVGTNLLLCYKVSTTIRCVDLYNYKLIDIHAKEYFQYQQEIGIIDQLLLAKYPLKQNQFEYQINQIEQTQDLNNSLNQSLSQINIAFIQKIIRVQVSRTNDWNMFSTKTHLNVREGDLVLGFDLTSINIDGLLVNFDVLPDVILVKTCPKEKKSKLKLKRLDFEPLHQDNRHKGKTEKDNNKKEFEEFLEDFDETQLDEQIQKLQIQTKQTPNVENSNKLSNQMIDEQIMTIDQKNSDDEYPQSTQKSQKFEKEIMKNNGQKKN